MSKDIIKTLNRIHMVQTHREREIKREQHLLGRVIRIIHRDDVSEVLHPWFFFQTN